VYDKQSKFPTKRHITHQTRKKKLVQTDFEPTGVPSLQIIVQLNEDSMLLLIGPERASSTH
jgi:hypothetical protein